MGSKYRKIDHGYRSDNFCFEEKKGLADKHWLFLLLIMDLGFILQGPMVVSAGLLRAGKGMTMEGGNERVARHIFGLGQN